MQHLRFLIAGMLLLCLSGWTALANAEMYMVSKSDLSGMTERVAERIFTGKQVEFNNRTLVPVNYVSEHPVRQKFIGLIIGKTDTEYTAYWATRRYVGLGAPPEEVRDRTRMLNLLGARENALGYIEATPEEATELRRRFTLLLIRSTDSKTQ